MYKTAHSPKSQALSSGRSITSSSLPRTTFPRAPPTRTHPSTAAAAAMNGSGRASARGGGDRLPPDPQRDPLEFLSRSWSASAADVSRAFAAAPAAGAIAEDIAGELDDAASAGTGTGSSFSFASAATSQLIMDRIMSHSQEVSPLTSGRLSHSSGPLNGGGSFSDSPPVSPDIDDSRFCRAVSTPKAQPPRGGSKTVGRWLKDKKEKRKEETRAHNAQVHAAVTVAAVAAAVAAAAAATAGSGGKDDRNARTDMAMASAATLVAAQCVEAAESMGAEREHLAAAVGSAVNARTPGDIVTITAAAATALRGAATLRARVQKEAWNVAAVIPVEKGSMGMGGHSHGQKHGAAQRQQQQQHHKVQEMGSSNSSSFSDDLPAIDQDENNFLGICCQELLARGTELLKRTRKGSLHWKVVSVYINRTGVVMLKMKSRHVAGTITKKKKSVVVDVCRDLAAWPGRHLLEGGEHRRYFGLRTAEHRVIEFECASQREHDMWTKGVARLLAIVDGRKRFA
ncbi:VAN3-binding protein-like isoform X3 [Hordeum vulgare subsp. vulgare]|uniref:VAN3-binding protein-like isoform X3 n=1 Tax=Hordeum vulgare subsp. vulgare TaxID=112509 RepID=UPI001D1A36F1|nr:VAN3-binding protein-like isoform X3 [Hordeum vulgare subsp. vulgare]